MLKKDFTKLQKEVRATLHSRELRRQATIVYSNPEMFTPLKRAWAVWTIANQSFNASLDSGWSYSKDTKVAHKLGGKRNNFTHHLTKRLEQVQVECNDAITVIKSRDSKNTFFYCDPPYFNANQGHYKGYTIQDFTELLETLAHIKGKFLLSSYPSEVLEKYVKKYRWKSFKIRKMLTATKQTTRSKTEVLTGNYVMKR